MFVGTANGKAYFIGKKNLTSFNKTETIDIPKLKFVIKKIFIKFVCPL